MPKKILLKESGAEVYGGAAADAIITPGDLIEVSATGVIRHATAGGNAETMFAVNAADQNRDIDSDYAAGEDVPFVVAGRGSVINARVAAAAAAIDVGDSLESAGDGTLRKHTPMAIDEGGSAELTVNLNAIVAVAIEAVDNSGGASPVRIKARVR